MKKKYLPDMLTPLNYLIKYNNIDGIKIISKATDFNINESDNNGETPLLKIIKSSINNINLIKLLLSYGADPNISDKNGMTPLIYSILQNNSSMVTLLIKYNADVNQTDGNNISPIKYSIKVHNIVIGKILLDEGKKKKERKQNKIINIICK